MKKATQIWRKRARLLVASVIGLVSVILILPVAYSAATPGVASFSVKDTSGAAVAGATIYAIPSADVDALAAQPITLQTTGNYTAGALNVDEPLEDLINGNYTPPGGGVGTYMSAVTDALGNADISGLSGSDTYFIYVKPADATKLPGGSIGRTAVSGASLDNKVTNIELSTNPSASATFVGSSSCLGCHSDKSSVKQTAHKNGFMKPRSPSPLQNASKFDGDDGIWNMFAALDNRFTAGDSTSGGTMVYFYAYDSTRKFDKFKTSLTDQGAANQVTVRIYKDTADGKYKFQFNNVLNPADPNNGMIKTLELTYGGGVYKQRYLTTVGSSIHMLPLQYNSRGDEAAPERTRKVFRDYHLDWWLNSAGTGTQTFKTSPANLNAVDVQCASCHFTGYNVTGDSTVGFTATGVADPNGETNPVSGQKQELNIGCERCHGPGSEHVAQGGAGKSIVTPQNTTPERETTICAQCHSRPQGNDSLGLKKDPPLNAANQPPLAGISRADYLANYTSRHDAASGDMWPDMLHSKSHHQQYTDFIQSGMYRNGSKLESCDSCHSVHAPGTERNQLSGIANDSLCLSCHGGVNSSDHQIAYSGFDMGATCVECHNAKMSSSGAGTQVLNAYPHGDISSHRGDVPDKTQVGAAKMPVPYTNTCGSCHWPLSNPPAGEKPALKLQKGRVYWASYADYTARNLSVDYNFGNNSAGIAGNAYGASVAGTVNSSGVSSINTPVPIGHIPAGYSAAKATTVKYHIPTGTSNFSSTVYVTAQDGANTSYSYPGPYPAP